MKVLVSSSDPAERYPCLGDDDKHEDSEVVYFAVDVQVGESVGDGVGATVVNSGIGSRPVVRRRVIWLDGIFREIHVTVGRWGGCGRPVKGTWRLMAVPRCGCWRFVRLQREKMNQQRYGRVAFRGFLSPFIVNSKVVGERGLLETATEPAYASASSEHRRFGIDPGRDPRGGVEEERERECGWRHGAKSPCGGTTTRGSTIQKDPGSARAYRGNGCRRVRVSFRGNRTCIR